LFVALSIVPLDIQDVSMRVAAPLLVCLFTLWSHSDIWQDVRAAEPTPASVDPDPIVTLFELVVEADAETAKKCLAVLTEKIQSREIAGKALDDLRPRLQPTLNKILAGKTNSPLYLDAALLAATWKDPAAIDAVRKVFLAAEGQSPERRLQSLDALVAAGDPQLIDAVSRTLADTKLNPPALRGAVLAALGRLEDAKVADVVLAHYQKLEPDLQPKAIELLTQRTAWSKSLLQAIGRNQIPAGALNANQVAKLLESRDEELRKLVVAKWGSVRTQRDPQREQVIAEMRSFIRGTPGDPHKGQIVFNKVCGQCHKIYGQGQEVGPDITANGRASFEQLLSNVFDPSLVIGASYQARTVITSDGRVLTGLLAEDSDQRVVLKVQGGKLETIARDDVEEMKVSNLSLMPEGLEKQLQPQELADLFDFLTLDKPPSDPEARYLPGTKEGGEGGTP
jgi:putative heme-binding domain-containing protein